MSLGFFNTLSPALPADFKHVDALTLSNVRLYDRRTPQPVQAVIAIVLALVSNILFKLGLVFAVGGARLALAFVPD